jgi:hypothetical protein
MSHTSWTPFSSPARLDTGLPRGVEESRLVVPPVSPEPAGLQLASGVYRTAHGGLFPVRLAARDRAAIYCWGARAVMVRRPAGRNCY